MRDCKVWMRGVDVRGNWGWWQWQHRSGGGVPVPGVEGDIFQCLSPPNLYTCLVCTPTPRILFAVLHGAAEAAQFSSETCVASAGWW